MEKRIKELRLQKKMTLLEMAKALGVSEATAQRYESGEIKNLKYDTIVALANLFNVSPAYLMGWDEDPKITQEEYYTNPEVAELAQQLKDRPELKVLFDASRDISKEDIQFVIDMIERMK